MTRDEALEKLRKTLSRSEQTKAQALALTADTAIASMGFDSLTILDLIYDVQQEFGLEFDPEPLARVRTIGELADFLMAQEA